MTRLESKTVEIEKPAEELFDEMSRLENLNRIMPERVEKFEAGEDSFLFGMKGIPDIRLKLVEKQHPTLMKFRSASEKLDFTLSGHLTPRGENTQLQFKFEGDFNPMVRMMVEKPLKNFIEEMANKSEGL